MDKEFIISAGVDQSNKGECLGPIFVSICYTSLPLNQIPYQGQSKSWSKKDYGKLNELIKNLKVNYLTQVIPIDKLNICNVNDCITEAMVKLINEVKPHLVYIDCHLPNPDRLSTLLQSRLSHKCELKVSHKADKTNSLVGLASLIATREKLKQYSIYQDLLGPIGSGNLADPLTINYIKKTHPNTKFLRKKWSLKSLKL